jgi:hypothetical protein
MRNRLILTVLVIVGLLILPVVLFADATSATSPGTCADDAAVGDDAWSNPSRATASDNSYSTAADSNATETHYLKCTNFSFAIPAGATINGITLEIERNTTSTSSEEKDSKVRIVKADGTIGTTDKASATVWPATDAYATYGGAADLWGEIWTSTDINDADFGAAMSATRVDSVGSPRVDHYRITVTYTPAAAGAAPVQQVQIISIF